jgi:hypothetical protein
MANKLLALPGLVAEPPEELEYEAVYAAVTATARGRWFLAEYNNRQRQADIALLLGAMARVEAVVCGKAEDLVPVALAERLRAAVPLIERLDSAIEAGTEADSAATTADPLLRELRELIEGALEALQPAPDPARGEAALSAEPPVERAEAAVAQPSPPPVSLDDDPLWQGGLFEPVENKEPPSDLESRVEASPEATVALDDGNSREETSGDGTSNNGETSSEAPSPPAPLSLIDAPDFLFAARPEREAGDAKAIETYSADAAGEGAEDEPSIIATVAGALLPAADFAEMPREPGTSVEVLPEMAIEPETPAPAPQAQKPAEPPADPLAALQKLRPEQLRALFG